MANPVNMKQKMWMTILLIGMFLFMAAAPVAAQCSICTKTTQQLGEKPARGMNSGILYLAFAPILIVGYIGYRWKKTNLEP